jgi:hypothetical protein
MSHPQKKYCTNTFLKLYKMFSSWYNYASIQQLLNILCGEFYLTVLSRLADLRPVYSPDNSDKMKLKQMECCQLGGLLYIFIQNINS